MILRISLIFAAISGFTAVALGAFGAHALKATLSPDLLTIWQTAVLYQFIHTLALIGIGTLSSFIHSTWQKVSACFFMLGIVLFSGSLYILVLSLYIFVLSGLGKLGMVTPIGGTCFLIAWLCFAIGVIKKRQSN